MWLQHLWYWLEVHTGMVNEPGPYYGFWSGFGSDIGEVALIGGVFTMYKRHNCHVTGCWRIAKYPVIDKNGKPTPFVVCKHHHPTLHGKKITHHHIYLAHRKGHSNA